LQVIQVLVLGMIWLVLSVLLAIGFTRWFRYLRDGHP